MASKWNADFIDLVDLMNAEQVERRIDVLSEISGVTFDEAIASRLIRDVDGRQVPFLGREMLIRNKRATARARDLLDADALDPPGK